MCDWSLGAHKVYASNFILKIGCDTPPHQHCQLTAYYYTSLKHDETDGFCVGPNIVSIMYVSCSWIGLKSRCTGSYGPSHLGLVWHGSTSPMKSFFGLQFHKQLYQWNYSRFDKSFSKTASHIVFLKICYQRTPCRMRWSREKPLFLAHSHPKALWEHVFRGFIDGAVSFYHVWQKTALNGS